MLNPDRRIVMSSCVDCVMWIANNDNSGIEDFATWHANFKRETANISDLFVDDAESFFTWHRCDTCGTALGGNRYKIIGYLAD